MTFSEKYPCLFAEKWKAGYEQYLIFPDQGSPSTFNIDLREHNNAHGFCHKTTI